MDVTTVWKSAVVQTVAVAALAVVLALALPHSFFEEWGWIAGPAAWFACAAVTARVLRLETKGVLIGAGLAGAPAVIGVVIGVHWLGTALGVVVFALWCGRLARDPALPAEVDLGARGNGAEVGALGIVEAALQPDERDAADDERHPEEDEAVDEHRRGGGGERRP